MAAMHWEDSRLGPAALLGETCVPVRPALVGAQRSQVRRHRSAAASTTSASGALASPKHEMTDFFRLEPFEAT